jgi:hypothetical protein
VEVWRQPGRPERLLAVFEGAIEIGYVRARPVLRELSNAVMEGLYSCVSRDDTLNLAQQRLRLRHET